MRTFWITGKHVGTSRTMSSGGVVFAARGKERESIIMNLMKSITNLWAGC